MFETATLFQQCIAVTVHSGTMCWAHNCFCKFYMNTRLCDLCESRGQRDSVFEEYFT